MKNIALFLILSSVLLAADKSSDGWSKKTTSYGGAYYRPGINSSPENIVITTYELMDGHKLIDYITKYSNDEWYKLYNGKDELIAKFDDLAAAKEAATLTPNLPTYNAMPACPFGFNCEVSPCGGITASPGTSVPVMH